MRDYLLLRSYLAEIFLEWELFGLKFVEKIKTHILSSVTYMGAEKSLARPGKKQATATEDFYVHISYL